MLFRKLLLGLQPLCAVSAEWCDPGHIKLSRYSILPCGKEVCVCVLGFRRGGALNGFHSRLAGKANILMSQCYVKLLNYQTAITIVPRQNLQSFLGCHVAGWQITQCLLVDSGRYYLNRIDLTLRFLFSGEYSAVVSVQIKRQGVGLPFHVFGS